MKINLKYYVIHNLEKERYENTLNLLKKYGVDLDDVTFVNHPNKNELTYVAEFQMCLGAWSSPCTSGSGSTPKPISEPLPDPFADAVIDALELGSSSSISTPSGLTPIM